MSNGVPIETVSKMLGHSKMATTQLYARVVEEKVSTDMQMLKKKLMEKRAGLRGSMRQLTPVGSGSLFAWISLF